MKFPSVEWFQALEEQAKRNAATFRRLGFCDAVAGIKVLPDNGGQAQGFVLTFDGYTCKSVGPSAEPENVADFVLEAKLSTWKEMIQNIQENGGADLHHTLNYLTLPNDPIKVTAKDQLKDDAFSRFNSTFQEFFDGAQHLQTEFAG